MRRVAILIILAIMISLVPACRQETPPAPVETRPEAPAPSPSPQEIPPAPVETRPEAPTPPVPEWELPTEEPVTPPPEEVQEPPTPLPEPEPALPQGFRVVGYITHWHFNRLSYIPLERLTHLIWQGVEITDGKDPTLRASNNADWGQISTVVAAGHASGIKVLVSLIGHWNESDLNKIWESPELRAKLIENLRDLVVAYNLDGIDLDNESTCDPTIYSAFIKELHEAIAPLGKVITMAGHPYRVCINPDVHHYVDFINLMTYDMGKGKGYPYHSTFEESVQAINLWAGSGIPKDKLLMGIPFYGRDGHVTFFEYWWIVEKYNPRPDQNQVNEPMAAGEIIWWNGTDLVKQKVRYVKDNDFGGVMLYEVGTDSLGSLSLLKSVFEALGQTCESESIGIPSGT